MTERIRELARTAEREVQISLGERWTTVGRAEFMRLYNEKFANLIVQECTRKIINSYKGKINPAPAVEAIEQHFGVMFKRM
jgi:hypothetical protein